MALDPNQFLLGPIAAQVKGRVSQQQWRKLVKTAHDKGFTVDSFLDTNTPSPLKARTQSSLTTQANKTIGDLYAPAEKSLTDQEARINALDAKRQQDQHWYDDWLVGKTTQLKTQADAADAQFRDANKQILAPYMNPGQQVAQAQQQAQQQPGTVSNMKDSTALGIDLPNALQRDYGSVAAQVKNTNEQIHNNQQGNQFLETNAIAQGAAQSAQRAADTWKQLRDVGDTRTKLLLDKGSKTAEEISKLLSGEVDKANANRDYAAVAQKLGLQQDTLTEKATHNRASEKLTQAQIDEQTRKDKATEAARAKELDVKWFNAATARDRAAQAAKDKKSGKKRDIQKEYTNSWAALSSARRGNGAPLTQDYVKKNRDRMIATVVADQSVSYEVARRAVDKFIKDGRTSPGSVKDAK